MRKEKPSRIAYKVAMNIITLSAKPGMDRFIPTGVVQTTEELLVASGVAGAKTVQYAHHELILFPLKGTYDQLIKSL
jgi:hypothetical protein